MGGYFSLELWNWDSVTFTGNTTYSVNSANIYLKVAPGQTTKGYNWDHNAYYGSNQFFFQGAPRQWAAWKTAVGVDTNSTYQNEKPHGTWTFVHPNKYEKGRSNIVIYNWEQKDHVPVDLSAFLDRGTAFEVRDSQNFFGPPVLQSTYGGGLIDIPMRDLRVEPTLGKVPNQPKHTGPEFGAFVILPH